MMKYLQLFLLIFLVPSLANSQDNSGKVIDSVAFDELKLTELCPMFGTDKCQHSHNYVEFYERLFSPIRDSVRKVFEIGVYKGQSHQLWEAYFSKAQIYGIDIDRKMLIQEGRISTQYADQANREDLKSVINSFGSNFDIIIDDGGHAMDHQQISFGYLFEHVRPGGYFIIEDVHTSLPQYFNKKTFSVNDDEANTTLAMIENYIRTSKIESEYLTQQEREYLELHIESVELIYRTTKIHSILCVIRKK